MRTGLPFSGFGGVLMIFLSDETTICRFCNFLVERGLSDGLFELIDEQLDCMGLILKRGSLFDVTLMEANRRYGGLS